MKIECPYCSQHYEIDKEYTNTSVKCVSCGQIFPVAIQEKTINRPVEQVIADAVSSRIMTLPPAGNREPLKALQCKNCGSGELNKEGELFICQFCGTKYTAEEAQLLTVNIKTDRASEIKNALANGRRALKQKDWTETEKYYNIVERYVPENMEAVFFSAYARIRQELINTDENTRKEKFDAFCNIFPIMEEYCDEQSPESMKEFLFLVSGSILDMLDSDFFHYGFDCNFFGYYTKGYPDYISFPAGFLGTDDEVYTEAMFLMCKIEFVKFIEKLLAKNEQIYLYEILLPHYERCLTDSLLDEKVKKTIREKYKDATNHLKQLAPDAHIPEKPAQTKTVKSFSAIDLMLYLSIGIFLVIAAVLIWNIVASVLAK